MKQLIERIIQRRNPQFGFDPALTPLMLWSFVWLQAIALMRGLRWLLYFRKPRMSMLGKGVRFFNTPGIRFGRFLRLGDGVYLSALGSGGITLGNNVGIGAHSRVVISTSLNELGQYIRIGNHVGIGEFAYLGGAGGLEIGDECIIGQYFSCHPENHNSARADIAIRHQGVTRKGIRIGANCWIGSKVTILDGVEIGTGSIIAAGAVVNRSFPANSVIGGVPARLIKSRP